MSDLVDFKKPWNVKAQIEHKFVDEVTWQGVIGLDAYQILKLATGKFIERDWWNILYDICEREHATCNDNCPVYRLNNHSVLKDRKHPDGCAAFKNGSVMRQFVLKKLKEANHG